ncbi:MAG: hypothetical protein J6O49_21655 [Bacteroidaceae bacterium]|nr:hypothetical protein [Bacteroidaceae bacterium]
MKKLLFLSLFIMSVMFNVVQVHVINEQEETLLLQDSCITLMREKLDTCMNRNERIYEQLYDFQDIRIKQLKGELPR